MKVKVLVFPCGSEIGLEVHNSLRFSPHVELHGASSVSDHGKFVYKNYHGNIPFVNKQEFLPQISTLVKKHNIDIIIPAHDSVVFKLSKNTHKLDCVVLGSPFTTSSICRSKSKTYKKLSEAVNVPKMYNENLKSLNFPVFLKPDVGQGSKGIQIAYSIKEVNFYLEQSPNLLVLEYLPGKEYTVDCFTDRHGALRFVGARERIRITNGISVNTKPYKNQKINKIANKINNKLNFRGVWFFQLKVSKNNKLTLMEVAPRVAGTMGLYRNIGVNFPLLSIYDALDMDISIDPNNMQVELDRALIARYKTSLNYNKVFVDLDDTLILRNRVNPILISFLYQCINNNIKTILITKHNQKFKTRTLDALKKFRLHTFFDKIINVPKKSEKYNYMDNKNSIFIDDSFAERQRVKDKLNIPVFDTNSIECLLDWKY